MQKLIVGLGNPGEKYKNTRHNVGFLVLEALKTEISKSEFLNPKQFPISNYQKEKKFSAELLKIGDLILAKPTTMMNDSGKAVTAITTFYKLHITNIFVVHDDLDIRLGEYKIQKGVGPKLHNGIESVDKMLGNKDYWRVRVGVENRAKALKFLGFQIRKRIPGEAYVLQDFTESELEVLSSTLDNVVGELLEILKR